MSGFQNRGLCLVASAAGANLSSQVSQSQPLPHGESGLGAGFLATKAGLRFGSIPGTVTVPQ